MKRFADRPARHSPRNSLSSPDAPENMAKKRTMVGESLFFFGSKLIPDNSSNRVEAYRTPRHLTPLFVRVYRINKYLRWQCIIRFRGFAAQFGGASANDALRIAEIETTLFIRNIESIKESDLC